MNKTFSVIALLLAAFPGSVLAQSTPPPPAPAAQTAPAELPNPDAAAEGKHSKSKDRRRAAKLYLAASKLFVAQRFEEAMRGYQQAAELDPANRDYSLAADVARSHAVTAFVQAAAKSRLLGNPASARASLAQALKLEPKNIEVTQHLYELGDDAVRGFPGPLYQQSESTGSESVQLAPSAALHSFHLHADLRQIVSQVFRAYGLDCTFDDSVRAPQARFDIDNVNFAQGMRALGLIGNIFYVPLDERRALIARDTRENRAEFNRQQLETIYLSGLNAAEITEVGNLAKNVFQAQQAVTEPSAGTITLRASQTTLDAFNATIRGLLDGHSQVMIDVHLIQLAHTRSRNTGIQPSQSMQVFNVAAEAQAYLKANQSLVDQIVSSGLAAPGDFMTILGILLASGQASNPLLSSGFATFGGSLTGCTNGLTSCSGALTTFGLAPGSFAANLSLNSSDSRELDQIQLRLGDGEASTLRSGSRYPIQTSSFSSLSASTSSIAGLTGAGTSSALSSLLSSLSSYVPSVPQVEYQDLGLTLKTTANVMRNNDVALTIDLKIVALSGSSINDNPILNNRSYSGVVTLRQGEGVVVASELDKSQSRAISGTPGFSEIPGLNSITDNDNQQNYATLLIVITPHVIRGTQAAGHTPMMRIEKGTQPN